MDDWINPPDGTIQELTADLKKLHSRLSDHVYNYEYFDRESEIEQLVAMAEDQNPELINDNAETAPSKRILKLIPEYSKVSGGVATVDVIGLDKIRAACRHFNEWLTELEALAVEE